MFDAYGNQICHKIFIKSVIAERAAEKHEDDNWGFGGICLVLILTTNKGSTLTSGVKCSLLGGVSW